MKKYLLALIISTTHTVSLAQHIEEISEESEESKFHVSVKGGAVFIPKGEEISSEKHFVSAFAFGLELEYFLNNKWAMAIVADKETKEYEIPVNGGKLERKNLMIVAALGAYRIKDNFLIFAGPGYEFEKHHNFFVLRVGLKYEIELENSFDLTPTFEFDFKEKYTSQFVGIAIGKKF
ncbi:hypothetical protein [Reichenbachiella sp.]|uniref:hypothetical protein n=1 Tax=Reichenbachiella sp. TaxID=2184521 RepID=UPI003B59CD50